MRKSIASLLVALTLFGSAVGIAGVADAAQRGRSHGSFQGQRFGRHDRDHYSQRFGPFRSRSSAYQKYYQLEEHGWECSRPYQSRGRWYFDAWQIDEEYDRHDFDRHGSSRQGNRR